MQNVIGLAVEDASRSLDALAGEAEPLVEAYCRAVRDVDLELDPAEALRPRLV